VKIYGRRSLKSIALVIYQPLRPVLQALGVDAKGLYELAYWKSRQIKEGSAAGRFGLSIPLPSTETTPADPDPFPGSVSVGIVTRNGLRVQPVSPQNDRRDRDSTCSDGNRALPRGEFALQGWQL
jgi:hypothetical protein